MAGYTNDVFTPVYSGISSNAVKQMQALHDAMDKAIESKEYWPCLNNPYFYMDYDGMGFEDEEGRALYKHITADEAEILCHGCPLIKQCYDFAVANEEKAGIWGGIDFSADDNALFPEDINA
jgi:hypothetical protein